MIYLIWKKESNDEVNPVDKIDLVAVLDLRDVHETTKVLRTHAKIGIQPVKISSFDINGIYNPNKTTWYSS